VTRGSPAWPNSAIKYDGHGSVSRGNRHGSWRVMGEPTVVATTGARKQQSNRQSDSGPTYRFETSPEAGPGATVGTQNQGYPLLQHEDSTPMRHPLATWRTAPDPIGWADQRAPRGRERHHTPVRPDPCGRTPDHYIRTSPEPPGESELQQGPGTGRTLVYAGVRR
jgi:hypothetical protein